MTVLNIGLFFLVLCAVLFYVGFRKGQRSGESGTGEVGKIIIWLVLAGLSGVIGLSLLIVRFVFWVNDTFSFF